MGYHTDFYGQFQIEPPLTAAQVAYVNQWQGCRRVKRDPTKAAKLPDPTREAVGLPLGKDAEFFAGGLGFAGQDRDLSVVDYNKPPRTQPGLWCKWKVSARCLQWDGCEKFYDYVPWLEYMIKNFFQPWGRTLSGNVRFQGEERGDHGYLVIENNVVRVARRLDQAVTQPAPMGDEDFEEFLQDATLKLREMWEERGGGNIGEMEGQSLNDTLSAWFGDKLSG